MQPFIRVEPLAGTVKTCLRLDALHHMPNVLLPIVAGCSSGITMVRAHGEVRSRVP